MSKAKVKGQSKYSNGYQFGTYDPNPLLNYILYDVKFPDGRLKQDSANIVAENMFSQVDEFGHSNSSLNLLLIIRQMEMMSLCKRNTSIQNQVKRE